MTTTPSAASLDWAAGANPVDCADLQAVADRLGPQPDIYRDWLAGPLAALRAALEDAGDVLEATAIYWPNTAPRIQELLPELDANFANLENEALRLCTQFDGHRASWRRERQDLDDRRQSIAHVHALQLGQTLAALRDVVDDSERYQRSGTTPSQAVQVARAILDAQPAT